MESQPSRDHPSPVLSVDEVRAILVERIGDAGAIGGSIGGSIGGAIGAGSARLGAAGGSRGGRAGGRFGARFTRLMGQGRTFPVPYSAQAHGTVRGGLAPALRSEVSGGGRSQVQGVLVGLLGTGWWNMNSAVVQLVWYPDRVEVTAHALEGLVNQRSAPKALDKIEELLTPYRGQR